MLYSSRSCVALLLALAAAGCGGGGGTSVTGPTASAGATPPTAVVGPPAGASLWTFAYRTARAHTCPAAVVATNAIFTGGTPRSATWPIVLDRQG
jgi:hypothetical protein